jgi:hypothetical protein
MRKVKEEECEAPRPTSTVPMAKIPVEILNNTIQYLATKPYVEVVEYINAIRQNAEMDE